MSGWVTQREAASLLGVHQSLIGKLVARGALTPRDRRPSLSRDQVVALGAARAAATEEAERRRTAPRQSGPKPPDDEHVWLRDSAAAAVLGCTVGALRARAVRGRVPSTVVARRRWFRLDHLKLVVRAEIARRTRLTP